MDIQSQINMLNDVGDDNPLGDAMCGQLADTMQLMLAVCGASRQACECVTHDSVQRCLDIVRGHLADLDKSSDEICT